jgi:hypothetical protein
MLIFTFSYNPTTKEAAFAGNIGIEQATQLLYQLAIADAVNKAQKVKDNGQDSSEGIPEKAEKPQGSP